MSTFGTRLLVSCSKCLQVMEMVVSIALPGIRGTSGCSLRVPMTARYEYGSHSLAPRRRPPRDHLSLMYLRIPRARVGSKHRGTMASMMREYNRESPPYFHFSDRRHRLIFNICFVILAQFYTSEPSNCFLSTSTSKSWHVTHSIEWYSCIPNGNVC